MERPLGDDRAAEALDRHVGQRVEPVEYNPKALAELALVVLLQFFLRWRQRRPLWVIDQVQHEPTRFAAVAELVESSQRADAGVEYTFATLAIDILFQVAGQRRDDLHPLIGEKLREIMLTRLLQNGEVAPVDHPQTKCPCAGDKLTKQRMQLRCATGHVERWDAVLLQKRQHCVDVLSRHLLRPIRPGRYVTMRARLVAAIAKVDLQGFEALATERREVRRAKEGKRGMQ